MLIMNYYRGGTDRVSGFLADTEDKTLKKFEFPSAKWLNYDPKTRTCSHKKNFKMPGDIEYHFPTKGDMELQEIRYANVGFTEDPSIHLNFGAFIL